MAKAPFRATIDVGLWVYSHKEARAVFQRLLEILEEEAPPAVKVNGGRYYEHDLPKQAETT